MIWPTDPPDTDVTEDEPPESRPPPTERLPPRVYSVNVIDGPGRCTQLSTHEGEDERGEAERWAREESRRRPGKPVEVWREGAYGPEALRRWVGGVEVWL